MTKNHTTSDDANVHGDLFVEFEIIFPDTLDQNQMAGLANIFGKKPGPSFHNEKDGKEERRD